MVLVVLLQIGAKDLTVLGQAQLKNTTSFQARVELSLNMANPMKPELSQAQIGYRAKPAKLKLLCLNQLGFCAPAPAP